MPHFGENSDIWPIYQPSKLKSRFLGTSFPRLTFIKVRRGPCLGYLWPWLEDGDEDGTNCRHLEMPSICEQIVQT